MNPFDSFHVGLLSLFMSQGKYLCARARLSIRTSRAHPSVVHSIFTFDPPNIVFIFLLFRKVLVDYSNNITR